VAGFRIRLGLVFRHTLQENHAEEANASSLFRRSRHRLQAALDRAMSGDDLKRLVADFNRDWPDITRTRELLVLAEEFNAAG
jgi:hypothetical protein